jgi:hypothetical protein
MELVAAAMISIGITGAGMVALAKFFGEQAANRWLRAVEHKHAKELANVESQLDRLNRRRKRISISR